MSEKANDNDEEENSNANSNNMNSYQDLLVKDGDPLYRELKKRTNEALKKARRSARSNEKYKELKKLMEEQELFEIHGTGQNQWTEEPDAMEEEQMLCRNKKRKVLKSFREYTNPQGDEGRFKGWSHRATDDMAQLTDALQEESEGTAAKRFRAAYRINYDRKLHSDKKKRVLQESVHENYQSTVWRLPVVDLGEIEI